MTDQSPDSPDKPRRRHAALSEVLAKVAADTTRERISIADLLGLAGDRAFGALLFVFALPNIVPTPPGTSAILGLPLVMLAAQLLYGRKIPWLPRVVGERSIARADFAAVIARANPVLQRVERVLKPRLGILVSPIAERLIGVVALVLAILIFLPIPLGNILPAMAICVLALALVEHDGLAVLIGIVLAAASLVIVWGAFFALIHAAIALFERFAAT